MHMADCISDSDLCKQWINIYRNHLEKSWTDDDWRRMFDEQFPEYTATTLPASDFSIELAKAYPEAKVMSFSFNLLLYHLIFKIILLYRDPDTWFPSFQYVVSSSMNFYDNLILWPLKICRPLHRMRDY